MIGIIATSCQHYELKSSKESLLYGTWTLKENQNIFDGINTKYTFNENHTGAITYLGYDYDENGNVNYVPKGYDFTWELKNDAIIISYLVGGGQYWVIVSISENKLEMADGGMIFEFTK